MHLKARIFIYSSSGIWFYTLLCPWIHYDEDTCRELDLVSSPLLFPWSDHPSAKGDVFVCSCCSFSLLPFLHCGLVFAVSESATRATDSGTINGCCGGCDNRSLTSSRGSVAKIGFNPFPDRLGVLSYCAHVIWFKIEKVTKPAACFCFVCCHPVEDQENGTRERGQRFLVECCHPTA